MQTSSVAISFSTRNIINSYYLPDGPWMMNSLGKAVCVVKDEIIELFTFDVAPRTDIEAYYHNGKIYYLAANCGFLHYYDLTLKQCIVFGGGVIKLKMHRDKNFVMIDD